MTAISPGLLAHGFGLGLLFCAPPGPVFAETLHRGLRGGFLPAWWVQFGSLAGDLGWAVVGLAGGATLLSWPVLHLPLALAGIALLGLLGVHALRDAGVLPGQRTRSLPTAPGAGAAVHADRSAVMTGVALSVSNPWNLIYWTALAGTLPGTAAGWQWPVHGSFLFGFGTACLCWGGACAGLIAWTRRQLSPGHARLLHFVCGAGLLAYSALLAWRLLDG